MKFNDPFSRPFGAARAPGTPLISNFEPSLLVGMDRIDGLHREFVDMVNTLAEADAQTFTSLFDQLLRHTRSHFDYENSRMEETAFARRVEHRSEHERVLGELEDMKQAIVEGRIAEARIYVCERLPSWFRFHVINMDSALASHLSNSRKGGQRK